MPVHEDFSNGDAKSQKMIATPDVVNKLGNDLYDGPAAYAQWKDTYNKTGSTAGANDIYIHNTDHLKLKKPGDDIDVHIVGWLDPVSKGLPEGRGLKDLPRAKELPVSLTEKPGTAPLIEIHVPGRNEQEGLPEFRKNPADSQKEGFAWLTDKAKEALGLGDTMHDRVKKLVLAGMTPEQKEAYEREEKEWKETVGSYNGPYNPEMARFKANVRGPMHDYVNQMALAVEKNVAAKVQEKTDPKNEDAYQQALLQQVIRMELAGGVSASFRPKNGEIPDPKPGKAAEVELHQMTHPNIRPWIMKTASW